MKYYLTWLLISLLVMVCGGVGYGPLQPQLHVGNSLLFVVETKSIPVTPLTGVYLHTHTHTHV